MLTKSMAKITGSFLLATVLTLMQPFGAAADVSLRSLDGTAFQAQDFDRVVEEARAIFDSLFVF